MKLFKTLFKRQHSHPEPQRVAIKTGSVITEVGSSAILHALFSTISFNLEPDGWGTRFPVTMNRLYQGSLRAEDNAAALRELQIIDAELKAVSIHKIVWDIEDLSKEPSPHYKSGSGAQNAVDYFITVNGLNLLRSGLIESVESALEFDDEVHIIKFRTPRDFFGASG